MCSPVRKKWLLSLYILCLPAFGAEVMFVQSKKATLRSEPSLQGATVVVLQRGHKLTIQEKKGIWYQVNTGRSQGWVSRLFLSQHSPVGEAELSRTLPTSLEKDSRRRPASYSVSASTRGLTSSERVRQGRELYRANYQALEKLEKRGAPDSDSIERFLKEGGLK